MFYSDEDYRRRLRRYTLAELKSALLSLDRSLYPQRYYWLQAEIKKRKEGAHAPAEDLGEGESELQEIAFLRTPLDFVRSWMMLVASCILIYVAFDWRERNALSRSECRKIAGTIDHVRLDSTEYKTRKGIRNPFRRYYHYFKIYGLAEMDGSFKYDARDFNSRQVWGNLEVGDSVEILYRVPDKGYYWEPMEIIKGGDTLLSLVAKTRDAKADGFGMMALGGFMALVSLGFVLFESDAFMNWIRRPKP